VPALDVRTQCTGFLYGLSIADAWIRSGQYRTILLVGVEVFKHAITRMPEVALKGLEVNGLTADDLDLVIAHQANARITEGVRRRLGIPVDRMYNNIQRYGNTTAASIPIALAEAVGEGRLSERDLLCLVAFGSGFTWGSALVRW